MNDKEHKSTSPITELSDPITPFYNGENYVIEASIGLIIKQVHQAMQRSIDARMTDLDLTAMQWAPLIFISQKKGQTAADIARCGGVDTGAVTRMLDRLEAKGLISRVRSATDKRIVHLELTPSGQEVAAKIPFILADMLNHSLRGFSNDEFETLRALMLRVLANNQIEPT